MIMLAFTIYNFLIYRVINCLEILWALASYKTAFGFDIFVCFVGFLFKRLNPYYIPNPLIVVC